MKDKSTEFFISGLFLKKLLRPGDPVIDCKGKSFCLHKNFGSEKLYNKPEELKSASKKKRAGFAPAQQEVLP